MDLEITPAKRQSTAIVPAAKSRKSPDVDALIQAYWLMFLRAPRAPDPDPDGFYDLKEIGSAPEKNWERLCPYSLVQPK
jgi:hypothetical protein